MTREQEELLKKYIAPKEFKGLHTYPYTIKHCPGYDGYRPTNLDHELCKYCGSIKYYH
jgi:hypothetical protein